MTLAVKPTTSPRVKVYPPSGSIGIAILDALAPGTTMTMEEIQSRLKPGYNAESVRVEICSLKRQRLIQRVEKIVKQTAWGRK